LSTSYGDGVTVYVVAQLKFTDRAAYDRYQAAFMPIFTRYTGTVLAADESPQVFEGSSDREKIVLLRFPDEASFRDWADSAEYQEISKDRRAGADTTIFVVKGLT
jgi:uncharacterized protein (DUF1330 family)